MDIDIFLRLGVLLFLSFIGGKLLNHLKMPNVSGYVLVGMFLGASLGLIFKGYGGFIRSEDISKANFISEVAISFIAFSIGSELSISNLKSIGKNAFLITIFESLVAVAFVFISFYFLSQRILGFAGKENLAFALMVASVAAATAPAATILIMREYRAYGPVSKTIIAVTALDDIVGIVVFGISLSVSKILLGLTAGGNVTWMILKPFAEIFIAIAIGVIFGLILCKFANKYDKSKDDMQVIIVSLILILMGITKWFSKNTSLVISPLLANIAMGSILVNIVKKSRKSFSALNDFTSVFYVLFFALAGASLNLRILKTVGLLGVVFVFARGIGKYLGAFVGAKIARAEKNVARYTGLALLPQGGIAIGLLLIIADEIPIFHEAMVTILMFSILVYETLGPVLAKIAISKAGEINGLDRIMGEEEEKNKEGEKK